MNPSNLLRPFRWLLRHKRNAVLILGFTFLLVLVAHPGALGDDVYGNISPAPQLPPGGWVGRYPVEHYQLDQYFPAISVGFTSGVDASGVVPMIAYFGAQVLWLITCFLANGVILLFALAFNLNLLTGNGSAGAGALAPISQAIHNLYTNTFGTPWLIATITLVGCWAMWKVLVQRRYTETASALTVSLLYFILAIGIVTQPEKTIAPASKLSNELSTAILSLTNEGAINNEEKAKTAASNQLFELLVLNPWTVLEFGGVEHCATVKHGKPHSVAVRPLSANPTEETHLASQLENGTEVKDGNGKVCINNRNKYATHFLAYPFQSPDRNSEHEALEHGDDEDLPETDPAKNSSSYPLGPADEPAAEAMGKGGQLQRLLLALVILLGEAGAYLLLGALALGVILAQILLLALLAFAPVALLVGIYPGRGHEFFRKWLGKLAGYLARKVIYSLILAVVLAVCSALDNATSNVGWLLAFALQAAFLWTIFLHRNKLTQDLLATVGSHTTHEDSNRLTNLYLANRVARMVPTPRVPSIPKLPHLPWSKPDSDESKTPPNKPAGGDTPPPPPDGSSPPPGGRSNGGKGGETVLPPNPPNPHKTPTHTSSPLPSTRTPAQGGEQATPAATAGEPTGSGNGDGLTAPSTPPNALLPATGRRNAPAEDELPSTDRPTPKTDSPGRPGSRSESNRERAAATTRPPATAHSTAEVTSAIVRHTFAPSTPAPVPAAPPAAPVSDTPPPAAPPPPAATQAPTSPAPTGLARDDALRENPRPSPSTHGAAAAPNANSALTTPPAVKAPSATQEPVALLLAARQRNAPIDPATPEDELA